MVSTGKILFSDDLMYPGYLSACLPFIESEQVGMVFSAVDLGTQSAGARPWYVWTRGPGVIASDEFVHDSLFSGNVPYSPGAFLFRIVDIRRFLLVNPPYRVGERYASQGMGPDLGLCLLTARAYRYVAHVPAPLVLFRMHPGSFTELAGLKIRLWNYNRVRKAILDQAGNRKLLRRWLAWSWLTSMAASRRVIGLSEHLKDLDVEAAHLRPGLEDIFWAGSIGMWPMLVRQSRHFEFFGQIGAKKNLPVPTPKKVA